MQQFAINGDLKIPSVAHILVTLNLDKPRKFLFFQIAFQDSVMCGVASGTTVLNSYNQFLLVLTRAVVFGWQGSHFTSCYLYNSSQFGIMVTCRGYYRFCLTLYQ